MDQTQLEHDGTNEARYSGDSIAKIWNTVSRRLTDVSPNVKEHMREFFYLGAFLPLVRIREEFETKGLVSFFELLSAFTEESGADIEKMIYEIDQKRSDQ